MNRMRSQLDALMERGDQSRPPAAHIASSAAEAVQRHLDQRTSSASMLDAPMPQRSSYVAPSHGRQVPVGQDAELERIRASLDMLAGKISAASNPRPPVQQAAPAPDADLRDIRRTLSDVRSEIANLTAETRRRAQQPGNDAELRAISNALTQLLNRPVTDSGSAASLHGEISRFADDLNEIREAVIELARLREVTPDLSGIARTVESGYERLSSQIDRQAARQDATLLDSHMVSLAGQLAEIRDVVDNLPVRFPIAQMHQQLDRLAGSIDRLGTTDDDALPGHFQSLEERLDEITRAVVALSAQPGNTDGLDRIEARIATLAKNVDAISQATGTGARTPEWSYDISRSLELLSNKFDTLAAKSQAPRNDGALLSRLEEISVRLEMLSQTGSSLADSSHDEANAEMLRTMEMRLAEIADRINDLQHMPAGTDHGLAARIDELAQLIETAQARPPVDNSQALESIEQQLGMLLHRVEAQGANSSSPDPMSTQIANELMARLDDLAARIDMQSRHDDVQAEGNHGLAARIDELAQLIEMSQVRPAVDNSQALESIEQQLAMLLHRVETQSANSSAPDPMSGQIANELMARLDDLAARIDMQPRHEGMSAMSMPGFDAGALDAISNQLSHLSQMVVDKPSMQGDVAPILSRLDQLAARFDDFSAVGPVAVAAAPHYDDEVLGAIEARLAEIAEMAASRSASPTSPSGGDDTSHRLVEMMEQLSRRFDAVQAPQAAMMPQGDELRALENQLADIAAHLTTIGANGIDLSPIADRLDNIEQQVANSRDIAIEVASQAAERAVELANQGQGDPTVMHRLADDLRRLEDDARALNSRNVETFEAVHDTLGNIASRLAEIEGHVRQPASLLRAEATQSNAAWQDQSLAHERVEVEPETRSQVSERSFEKTEPSAEWSPERAVDRSPELAAQISGQFSAQTAELRGEAAVDEVEEEDVPLEPGTGIPDLAELVRRQSAKRQAGGAPAINSADMIAAARRAAQATVLETEAEAATSKKLAGKQLPGDKAPADEKPAGKLSALGSILSGKRRVLLAAAAATVLVALMAPIAANMLFGGGAQPELAQIVDEPAAEGEASQDDTIIIAEGEDEALEAGTTQEASEQDASAQGEATRQIVLGDGEDTTAEQSTSAEVAADPLAVETASGTETASTEVQGANGLEQEQAPLGGKPGSAITEIPVAPEEAGNIVLRQAAASGDGNATFEIARRYTDGDGVDRDLAKAAQWYEHAAKVGHAPSQYRIGNFYEKGYGVTTDLKLAASWYEKAADQGNALAMHNLAVLYASGLLGSGPDMPKAVKWFTAAADLGVKDSQVNLGILYTRGMGVPENLVDAYKWFAVAAKGGDADAGNKRDTLANAMRPEQLEQARGETELWKPKPLDDAANQPRVADEWTRAADSKAAGLSQGQKVQMAQELLKRLGYDPGPADGLIGAKTRDAIRAFQKKVGMTENGEIDNALIDALSQQQV